MTHQAKQNVQTATNVLILIGLIAGGVFYFTDIRTTNATQDEKIGNISENVNDLSKRVDKQDERAYQQGKDLAVIRYYFEHGLLDRLQLEGLQKQAASANLITNQND